MPNFNYLLQVMCDFVTCLIIYDTLRLLLAYLYVGGTSILGGRFVSRQMYLAVHGMPRAAIARFYF